MFAWQGWKLDLPDGWNPVKLEGDFARGHALIADMHQPRLGLRWTTPRRKFDASGWARKTLVDEVGKLAADEARGCETEFWRAARIYHEPDPPGRDVFVAYSAISGRTIELVTHLQEFDVRRTDDLVHSLKDSPADADLAWSVFDLSCRSPGNWRLASQRLNAGDLSLSFRLGGETAAVRQIAIAELALKRLPLEKWLAEQQRRHAQTYRSCDTSSPRPDKVSMRLAKRRRFFWAGHLPREIVACAWHDESHDRLVLADASSDSILDDVVRSVGWACDRKLEHATCS